VTTPARLSILALVLVTAACAANAAETCSLHGVVSEPSGQPAPSVWVLFTQGPDGPEQARSLTTDNGKYYVSGMQAGTYTIKVRRGETTWIVENGVRCAGDQTHDIRLP
jgi:hypothetical protein